MQHQQAPQNASSKRMRFKIAIVGFTIFIFIGFLLWQGVIKYSSVSVGFEVSGMVLNIVFWLFPLEPISRINAIIKSAIRNKRAKSKNDFSIIYLANDDQDWYTWFYCIADQEKCTVRRCEWDGSEDLSKVMKKEKRVARHVFSIVTSKFLDEAKKNPGYHDFKKMNCSRKLRRFFKEHYEFLCVHKGPLVELKGLSNDLKLNLVNLAGMTETVMRETFLSHISGTITGNSYIDPQFPGEMERKREYLAPQQYFTGRTEILVRIRQVFQSGTRIVALHGLKGIGKTQIALAYAQSQHDWYRHVFLLRMSSDKVYEEDLKEIGATLELAKTQNMHSAPRQAFMNEPMLRQAFVDWANKSQHSWLLILDDCNDSKKAHFFHSTLSKGHIVLTTSQSTPDRGENSILIPPMKQQEGALFLLRRTGILTMSQDFEQASKLHREEALEISQVLGNLPEALEIAGMYINYIHGERNTPIQQGDERLKEYLNLYQNEKYRLKEMYKDLRTRNGDEVVVYAWYISFEWVKQTAPEACETLLLCSLLGRSAIPIAIIQNAFQIAPIYQSIPKGMIGLNNTLGKLLKLSLLERENDVLIINTHVQDFLSSSIEGARYPELVSYVIKATAQAFPEPTINEIQRCKQYEPHVKACEALIEKLQLETEEVAQLYDRYGCYLREMDRYEEAEEYLKKGLDLYKKLLSVNSIEIATSMGNLAELYYVQSKLYEAERLYLNSLQIYNHQMNANSLEVALLSRNLAIVYDILQNEQEAEKMHEKALHIWEPLLASGNAPESFARASLLKGMAYTYYRLGNHRKADDMYKDALAICEKEEEKEGKSFPETDVCRANLARFYFDRREADKYEVAELYYRWTLKLYRNIFGIDHSQVAVMHRNLADLHAQQLLNSTHRDTQEHYNEAVLHYEEALTIYVQKLPASPEITHIQEVLQGLQDKNPFHQKERERRQRKKLANQKKMSRKKKRNVQTA